MLQTFQASGAIAVFLMFIAGFTGAFGPKLRKIINGPVITKAHRVCGVGALVSGLVHGLIYLLYFM